MMGSMRPKRNYAPSQPTRPIPAKPPRFGWRGTGVLALPVFPGAVLWNWHRLGVDPTLLWIYGFGFAVVMGVILVMARPWGRRPY